MHRNPDYTSYFDGGTYPTTPGAWNPVNGVGFWTWNDYFRNSQAWIDLPNVHGLLVVGKIGQGNGWYQGSTLHSERGSISWFVYDPADLRDVAQGTLQQYNIQPRREWTDPNLQVPDYDINGWSGEGGSSIGIAFDPTTNRLYCLRTTVRHSGVEYYPQVEVFQVG